MTDYIAYIAWRASATTLFDASIPGFLKRFTNSGLEPTSGNCNTFPFVLKVPKHKIFAVSFLCKQNLSGRITWDLETIDFLNLGLIFALTPILDGVLLIFLKLVPFHICYIILSPTKYMILGLVRKICGVCA